MMESDGATHICSTASSECCNTSTECDDADSCTDDDCIEAIGKAIRHALDG